MRSNKVYVDVVAKFSRDGVLLPVEITWEDGKKYEISWVKDKRKAASTKAGGVGERSMKIIICGLWKEPEPDMTICD